VTDKAQYQSLGPRPGYSRPRPLPQDQEQDIRGTPSFSCRLWCYINHLLTYLLNHHILLVLHCSITVGNCLKWMPEARTATNLYFPPVCILR